MRNVDNYNDLFKFLQQEIDDSMETDVSEEVKIIVRKHIQDDVYDAYTPYSTDGKTPYYTRTYQLLDDVESNSLGNGEVFITDSRSENGRDITEIIETGKGYNWGYTRNLDEEIGARPFIERSAEEISRDNVVGKVLKESLRRKGFNIG